MNNEISMKEEDILSIQKFIQLLNKYSKSFNEIEKKIIKTQNKNQFPFE